MDMFDLMKSANSILGKHSGQVNLGNLAGSVMGMMSKDQGGINGLLDQFQNNGLGDIAQSWVSMGENQPVSTDQLVKVFGHEKLSGMAGKVWDGYAGLSADSGRRAAADY